MKTIGICNAETSSVCLMVDGKLVNAASEERFTRKKMDDAFPHRALEFVLVDAGLTLSDIDQIAYSWGKGFDTGLVTTYTDRAAELARENQAGYEIFRDRIAVEIERDSVKIDEFWDWARASLTAKQQKQVVTFYHHEAHALSAALFSPFENAMAMTIDGRGDFESLTLWLFERSSSKPLRKIFSSTSSDSLGFFYGRITGLLGFTPCRHEGKITGLAAHGDPAVAMPLMQSMISLKDGKISAELGDFYRPFYTNYSDELVAEVAKYSREDIAAAAQLHVENLVCDLLKLIYAQEQISSTNMVLAGGVFGNVRITQRIKELDTVDQVFVQPQMGDGGLCLGAAAGVQFASGIEIVPINSMCLGPTIDTYKARQLVENDASLQCEFVENVPGQACSDLEADRVVGLAHGRMEFGPRALCHRSIIYKTSDRSANDWLNKRMNRTEFMPFAPVIRAEEAPRCFDGFKLNDHTLRYMTATVNCTDLFVEKCPAVCHIDNTARPQIVTQDSDRYMWDILTEWVARSDELSLVNTSFNAHEEPIVCSEADAIGGLTSGMIDVLYCENLRITRV